MLTSAWRRRLPAARDPIRASIVGLYWITASPTMTSMPRKTGLAPLPILEPKRVAVVLS
jgi:hypothetical protein